MRAFTTYDGQCAYVSEALQVSILQCHRRKRENIMEEIWKLGHLLMTLFLYTFATMMVIPAITDVTMFALCPDQDQCSVAIYFTGLQQVVSWSLQCNSLFCIYIYFYHFYPFNVGWMRNLNCRWRDLGRC